MMFHPKFTRIKFTRIFPNNNPTTTPQHPTTSNIIRSQPVLFPGEGQHRFLPRFLHLPGYWPHHVRQDDDLGALGRVLGGVRGEVHVVQLGHGGGHPLLQDREMCKVGETTRILVEMGGLRRLFFTMRMMITS